MKSKEIAKAFLLEAKDSLESAEILFKERKYSKVVQNSQQASELTLKAALILKNITISEHKIFFVFAQNFKEDFPVEKLREIAELLERQGVKPRYPLFEREDLPVWIPSKEYKREDAEKFLQAARKIYLELKSFLEKKYNL